MMYGLFEVIFDYYSCEALVAVSAVKENLEEHYKEIKVNYPLYDEKTSDEIKSGKNEEFHYVIKEVKEV